MDNDSPLNAFELPHLIFWWASVRAMAELTSLLGKLSPQASANAGLDFLAAILENDLQRMVRMI
jgi:hypothetical protein